MKEKARGSFASNIGFVLAAAGSAVGLGNLWRFPYLAAKDGGGLFLLIYILASLTFGFALMTTEIAIGRKTRTTPLQAYSRLDGRFRFLGVLATAVPVLIFPYYCVIGGWVTKYASLIDRFGIKRSSATVAAFALSVVIGLVVCLGYNVLYADIRLPNGTVGQLLDVLDYLTNNLMLPVVALLTCVLIGWLCGPGVVLDEVRSSLGGKKFRREKLYSVMIRFVAPVLLVVILLQAFNFFSFLE